mmetsp:Transcript_39587/g.35366  ORF Transcript_39587/g.35366 Transcript_39587/m.35366 type:complete len:85 (+) Transcript_39587:1284-1538(+)|eukprot:CAMPEP_0114576130 /NCGR_PEP_ID=MMETSP0125-20121206/919_1 /TAXON_ID=485358 ORGANISM="Aristerostoma sp., Strain ATCC 50986" /NCGR_SAMPLE_ID=MMETSP0125 /ASSEMBLY_ACC=CAM_ASM_000245 /LENGTH=84 /DNA_ID=CAMNT_0001764391 /DNA_START=463 /DNA_END=717 /DNA_ORIENTATION=-
MSVPDVFMKNKFGSNGAYNYEIKESDAEYERNGRTLDRNSKSKENLQVVKRANENSQSNGNGVHKQEDDKPTISPYVGGIKKPY